MKYDDNYVVNFLLENKTPDPVSFNLEYNAELGLVILGNTAVGLFLSLFTLLLLSILTF